MYRMKGAYMTIHLASMGEGLSWGETRVSRIKEEITISVQLCGTKSLQQFLKWF